MSITAKELAEKLGLSPAAVSMALNNKPGVSTKTRQKVLDAAIRYGYDLTKISSKKKGGSIYFLVYKKYGTIVQDTAFFSELFEGVGEGCRKRGYRLNIRYIYDSDDTLNEQIEEIQYSDCCGVILLGTEMAADRYPCFRALRCPIVILDTCFENIAADYVLINNRQGAFLATDYLIQRTKKQPGHLKSAYMIENFRERSEGFYDAVRAGGFSASRSIVHSLSPSAEGAFSDMMEILESGEETASCYFADNDQIAVGALKAFLARGFRVPEDVSIAGFDNISYVGLVEPGLTTIHVPKKEMGETAAHRLADILERGEDIPMKIEIATRLIKRKSA